MAPAVVGSFDGITNVNGVLPPDPTGDVGPNHYVQMVNLSFAVYSRSGTRLYGPAATSTLWQGFGGPCETGEHSQPHDARDVHRDGRHARFARLRVSGEPRSRRR